MIVKTSYEHIVLDENRVAQVAGANTKVIEIVLDQLAYGWSPEKIHRQHPHLSLGQIYSALAYYWDHQAEVDANIEQRLEVMERMRVGLPPSRLVAKLRANGLSA